MSTPGTVNYPTLLDDVVSLLEAKNGSSTTLSADLSAAATTANVGSTSTFPTTGAVVFGGVEIAYYTGKTATTLTGLIRGTDGTSASAHLSGATVQGRIIARHHTVLADALIATQSKLDTHAHAASSLTGTALAAAVVTSSLTAVGTIAIGVWNGSAIADTYLATIATALKVSNSATTATSANTASAIVARDASGNFSADTITASLTGLASLNLPLAGGTVTGQITSTLGTLTTDIRALSATATWNNAAVAFNGLFLNVTNTASAATSRLLDLQVGGVSRFSVDTTGVASLTGFARIVKAGAATSVPTNWKIEADVEGANPNQTALYIYPESNTGSRLYFGNAGRRLYALNFAYVDTMESVPRFTGADGFDFGFFAGASHNIGRTTTGTIIKASGPADSIRFFTDPTYGTATERLVIDVSGNVGIGATTPNAAAILQADSITKGFLPPRMTTVQRDAITTPPVGLVVMNTTTSKLNVRGAAAWEAVTSS